MVSETMQVDILLVLLQFVALSIPAVAILLQVVLQLRSEHDSGREPMSGWDFRAIEGGFIALVLSGVLLAGLVVQSIQSVVGRVGVALAMFGLFLLLFATWVSIRRPKYPTDDYETLEGEYSDLIEYIFKYSSSIFIYVTFVVNFLVILAGVFLELLGMENFIFPDAMSWVVLSFIAAVVAVGIQQCLIVIKNIYQ